MRHELFSLFRHRVLIRFDDCLSVMIHCINLEAYMGAKHVNVFTTIESKAKIWSQ